MNFALDSFFLALSRNQLISAGTTVDSSIFKAFSLFTPIAYDRYGRASAFTGHAQK